MSNQIELERLRDAADAAWAADVTRKAALADAAYAAWAAERKAWEAEGEK